VATVRLIESRHGIHATTDEDDNFLFHGRSFG
jgi:hypothetical protein